MYVIDIVISRNRSVENRLSFAHRKLSVVTVKWNVHRKKGLFYRGARKNMAFLRFSYFNNQQQEKKLTPELQRSKVDHFSVAFVS